eukprot:TRINITY_DN24873_c0_g1_i1.p2 TRINITY_DN24873_c0_g1~~TRINITY_DN24873_c0_g1_i1.p2  ORF type:complete len:122 (-),score=21.44 TRINITY_DN24873_c0_g1_i1:21-386(-)
MNGPSGPRASSAGKGLGTSGSIGNSASEEFVAMEVASATVLAVAAAGTLLPRRASVPVSEERELLSTLSTEDPAKVAPGSDLEGSSSAPARCKRAMPRRKMKETNRTDAILYDWSLWGEIH